MEANPLKQYFRQPAIYIRLPSQGKFWPKNSVDIPPNGELPVLPMTTRDEITYRTPDALFNGAAVTSVIQSCIPNIKDAWQIPATDIDTILIAIRIATYGHELDIDTKCPACENETAYGVDLRLVMEGITCPDYNRPLTIGDLELWFRPMTYKDINDSNLAQFEDQKILQSVADPDMPDQQRAETLGVILQKITAVTTHALSQNIAMVKTPQAHVSDMAHIKEWLSNCDRGMFNQVKDHVIEAKKSSEIRPIHLQCPNCSNEYDQQFTLDMTTFFADAS